MAQSEHLPIYKASCDFSLYVEQLVHGFSRYHKYSLGTELREGARWVLRLVVRANGRCDKVPVLLEIRERCEDLKVLLRLGHDAKALPNFRAFEHAITQVVGIAKQNEGWLKYYRQPMGLGQNRRAASAETASPGVP